MPGLPPQGAPVRPSAARSAQPKVAGGCDAGSDGGLRPILTLPFDLLRDSGIKGVRVDDAEIADAFRLVLSQLRLLAEPSGAAALAGALQVTASGGHHTIGVLLTGGNVESALVAELLTTGPRPGIVATTPAGAAQ
ncbi:pyridoxal-phosphate dependent enzyme [Actinoplanes sp. NPDC051859]|uniref:pyridoxal-phosphate dependent enzyme n=1 Tax=Actinoplanes sp. NPDC051859 TaxID=3363909 RepID=UPI00378D15AF